MLGGQDMMAALKRHRTPAIDEDDTKNKVWLCVEGNY